MTARLVAALLASSTAICASQALAPATAKLEMYNAAYRAFDAGKFPEALKQLDAVDARQPDLAASKNLRGVILMRQGNYDQAEASFTQAAKIDPKFWNAGFNLAEIPFLKKDWAEARERFGQLLPASDSDHLASEASQLIEYKILLTYLMEGKSNIVDSTLAKPELSLDPPAVDYVKAAVALQQKNEAEAKGLISAAEKNYSPQLNKLFAESLYEIGWLQKPTQVVTLTGLGFGGTIEPWLRIESQNAENWKSIGYEASTTRIFSDYKPMFRRHPTGQWEIVFVAPESAPTAELEKMYNLAYRAVEAGNFPEALKQLDTIEARQPHLAASKNLRGLILMRQGNYDQAEAELNEAARIDPKLWNARLNLAEIQFLKKDWVEARKRFERLLSPEPSDLLKEAFQVIQYKILLTYLMQDKSDMVDSIVAKLELSPDIPAVDYAKAAVALQQKNEPEAKDWISAAEKNYPPRLNNLFAEPLYEIGLLKKPVIHATEHQ